MVNKGLFVFIVVIYFLSNQVFFSQNTGKNVRKAAINVYLDCDFCDKEYIRDEIQFVNFVRDRKEADLHILVTRQRTGGRGRIYSMDFIGLKKYSDISDTLEFSTNVTDTDDSKREKMTDKIKLGLIPYIIHTPWADKLTINFSGKKSLKEGEGKDEWDNWVFTIHSSSQFNGEESSKSFSGWGGLYIRRVTEEWKINASLSGEYHESRYKYDEDEFINISRSYRTRFSVIKSIDDHWSTGLWLNYYSSTYSNIKGEINGAPGIEFNIFPYSESTRKQLRLSYKIWSKYRNYFERTIYFKNSEFLVEQTLSLEIEIIQPWGNFDLSLRGANYLHDFSKNSFQVDGGTELKIYKGLSLRLDGGFSAVHNQLALPGSGASIDEILLRQKELATDFQYWGSFGFSYTFGSIFNNIVNPRFGG